MRNLLILVIVAALGYSGYWWVGATAKEQAIRGWLDQQRAAGREVSTDGIEVTGYPNRFDTILRDVSYADPAEGWAWTAPWFEILALSYKPNHVIAVWPPSQAVRFRGERISVDSDRIRGSLRFAPSTSLALRETRIEFTGVTLHSERGWRASLGEGQVALRESPGEDAPENGYDLSLKAQTMHLPAPLRERLDPDESLPATLASADIRATPVFDRPLDRHAGADGGPRLTAVTVEDATLVWGRMELTASGRLEADDQGLARGQLKITARDWKRMLTVAVDAGLVPENSADTLRNVLGMMARVGGNGDRISVTLAFSDGMTRLGPVPLGPAPRLY